MDPRERGDLYEESLHAALDGLQVRIWTSLPGIIESFDEVKMTAVVQPALMGVQFMPDGTTKGVNMPLLLDCPVVFPSGGGFTLTFPIKKGDECEVRFSARCIDAWWQNGGVQPQAERRLHNLSDGMVYVGPRSQPRVIPNISTTSTQLRSDDGSTFIDLAPNKITLKATDIEIDGALKIVGDTTQTGAVTASGEGTFNGGHTVSAHKHGGVQTGGSQTATPTG